jgi:hypothetical protein
MKLIKKVAIIGLATFALGSTVAFGDDTPICAKNPTDAVTHVKDLKDAPSAPAAAVKSGVVLPATPPATTSP